MEQKDNKEIKGDKYPLFPSTRFTVYLMLFLTCLFQYAGRFALNMSIVCMVVPTQQQQVNESTLESHDIALQSLNTSSGSSCEQHFTTKKDFGFKGEFYWSRPQVGYILAAFSYSYIPMQIIAGMLADKFGIRHVLGTGMLMSGVLTLLTPIAARLHYGLLIAVRVGLGFTMGMVFPCIHSAVGKWVPPSERGTFFGFVFSGPSAGTIIAFLLSGYLCQYSWTIVFYLVGGMVTMWYFSFLYVVYDSPEEHPRISEKEKNYIENSNRLIKGDSCKRVRIQWRGMLKSHSVYALCITQFSLVWLINTLVAGMPLYLQDVMFFSIRKNGVLSSLPYITTMLGGVIIGVLCDVIHRRIITSRYMIRKTAETLCAVIAIACIVSASYMNCNQRVEAIVLLCLMYFATCFKRVGMCCSPSDFAPRMAGLVYGISNFVGNFSGFLAPIAIGNLTKSGTQTEWQRVFFLLAGVMGIGWLSFMFCVSTYEEQWAREENGPARTETTNNVNDLELKVTLKGETNIDEEEDD